MRYSRASHFPRGTPPPRARPPLPGREPERPRGHGRRAAVGDARPESSHGPRRLAPASSRAASSRSRTPVIPTLVGGDTVRGPLGMNGDGPRARAAGQIRVDAAGARPGDGVYVTGHPGDAVAGRLLLGSARPVAASPALRRKFLYPSPRVREGTSLARSRLGNDRRLRRPARRPRQAACERVAVGADLDAGLLPLSPALRQLCGGGRGAAVRTDRRRRLRTAVHGAAPGTKRSFEAWFTGWSCGVTRLGEVAARVGLRWRLGGKPLRFADRTFRHFG